MAIESTTLPLYAGEKRRVAMTLKRDGAPVDLTGVTLFIIGKRSLNDDDSDAVLPKQAITTHTEPEAGKTAFDVDLTELDATFFSRGGLLFSCVTIKDADGNVETFGTFKIEIRPTPLRSTVA